jgi:hypothetical protein
VEQLIAAIRVVAGLDEGEFEAELPAVEEHVNGKDGTDWDDALALNGAGDEAHTAH